MTRRRRLLGASILGAIALAVAFFVWPTPYTKWRGGPANTRLYRRSRVSGEVERLDEGSGWVDVTTSSVVPAYVLAKLDGTATWSSTGFSLRLYNGSPWSVTEVTVGASTSAGTGGTESTVLRVFRLGRGHEVAALKTETLFEQLDVGPQSGQAWGYTIRGARGIAPAKEDTEAWAENESLRRSSAELLGECAALGIASRDQLTHRVTIDRALLDTCQQLKLSTKELLLDRLFGHVSDAAGRALLEACSRAGVASVDDLVERLLPPEPTGADPDPDLVRIWRDVNVWRQSDFRTSNSSSAEPNVDVDRVVKAELLSACADIGIRDAETLREKAGVTPAQQDILALCAEHRILTASGLVERLFGEGQANAARGLLAACQDRGVDSAETLLHRLLLADPFQRSVGVVPGTADSGAAELPSHRRKDGGPYHAADPRDPLDEATDLTRGAAVPAKPKPRDAFDEVFRTSTSANGAQPPSADTIDDLQVLWVALGGTAEDRTHMRSRASMAELRRIWQEIRRWREAHDGRQRPEPRSTNPRDK